MFSELFDFMKTSSQDIIHNKKVNLGNRRIKSISSFSSNSIFYFPVVISDQCQMDEVTMIQRALEKQYASFIVACISQIPFHRVSSGDAFAVDEYLKQFHQNMGVSPGKDAFAKAYNAASLAGVRLPFEESASGVESVEDFFARVWNESVEKECDYVTYLAENYISINDVFTIPGLDTQPPWRMLVPYITIGHPLLGLSTWGLPMTLAPSTPISSDVTPSYRDR